MTAGNHFFVGQLHPPAVGLPALQKDGVYFREGGMVLIEICPVVERGFLLAAVFFLSEYVSFH